MPKPDNYDLGYAEFTRAYEAALAKYRAQIDQVWDGIEAGIRSREDVLRVTKFAAVDAFSAGLIAFTTGKAREGEGAGRA